MTELIDNPPPLPSWSRMDDLGGLVPSEIRMEIHRIESAAFARGVAAGRNAGLEEVHAAIEAADDGEQSAYRHCQELARSLKQ